MRPMDGVRKLEKKYIEKISQDNFIDLMPYFYEMESTFLSGIYKRYGDLEKGNIVIFFARDLHLKILRKREINLSFDLSLDEFWHNHKNIIQSKKKNNYNCKRRGSSQRNSEKKNTSFDKGKTYKKNRKKYNILGTRFQV